MTPRSAWVRWGWAALLGGLFVMFVGLGTWQLQRRVWKLDLIERVDARVHAEPVAPPPPAEWPSLSAAEHEYRRVRLAGIFDHERETLVQASTVLGSGFWVLTPLRTADGLVVLVNRGFVPSEQRDRSARASSEPQGRVGVTGLLRLSEPDGALLRPNRPAENRWATRDVAGIAAARGLSGAAPYFVDAEATPPGQVPVGGLTVIDFPNHHLVYALTWYGLAVLVVVAARLVWREERRRAGTTV